MKPARALRPWELVGRVAAALFGVWAATWALASAAVAALVALGMEFHDAEQGVLMLALLGMLGLFLWAFTARSLWRLWLALLSATALGWAMAWLIQRAIVS